MSSRASEAQSAASDPSAEAPGRSGAAGTAPFEPVPAWRWGLWYSLLGAAIVVFYVVLTPIWLGLRALAWLAEFRSRRESPQGLSPDGD